MTAAVTEFALRAIILPFFVTLICSAALARRRLAAIAAFAGYAAGHVAIAGYGWPPTAAIPRLLVAAGAAALLGAAIDRIHAAPHRLRALALMAACVLPLWVLGLVLAQRGTLSAVLVGLTAALYCAWIVAVVDRAAAEPSRAAVALVGLGFGTGGTAIFCGSGLLGELSIAAGACAAACLALDVGTAPGGGRNGTTRGAALPLALVTALCGILALRLAALPWYYLCLLGVVPLVASARLPRACPPLLQTSVRLVFTLSMAGASIELARRLEGGIPL